MGKNSLAKIVYVFFIATVILLFQTNLKAQNTKISVLQLNIWQEGTKVQGGYEAIVDEISRLSPNFVLFSEVRNYNNQAFHERIIKSLKAKGHVYYSFFSDDSGILSKHPITDSATIYGLKHDNGSIYKLKTIIDGISFAVYTAHLDYKNYANYLPRGYNGKTWLKMKHPVIDTLKIAKMNHASEREEAIQKFIEDANREFANGSNIILAGDFNEPSFKDWTEETKNSFDHNGVVYKWPVSLLLDKHGYIDAYRELYPSTFKNPGFTYPSDNKDKTIKKLTWAPKADERDRIDFIFYKTDNELLLKKISILGPKSSIKKNKRVDEQTEDVFIKPLGVWPSDHKGVFAEFELKRK